MADCCKASLMPFSRACLRIDRFLCLLLHCDAMEDEDIIKSKQTIGYSLDPLEP